MFKIGKKWLKKATTKEDAKETKLFDGFPVYFWNQETGEVRVIDTFATEELAKAGARYLKSYYKNLVIMNPAGGIVEML